MATLWEGITALIGSDTATAGLRFYLNHSITATAGAGAAHALTLERKVEGPPPLFPDDASDHYPGAYMETIGPFPTAVLRGQHYECEARIRVSYIGTLSSGQRPKAQAKEYAVKITDNVMKSDRLGLDYISLLSWAGLDDDNDVARYLPLLMPQFFVGSTLFVVQFNVEF
jgi:hypothetical protein